MSFITRVRQQSLAWLVFFVIVVDLIGFGIVIPILPFLSPQLAARLMTLPFSRDHSVAAAIVAPIWGRLSTGLAADRFSGYAYSAGRSLILFWPLLMNYGSSTCREQWRA